ncbi:hypothetical protein TNCV_1654781 [Trichonephila clavipes]|nr:hypothetical protein TNCV_1654781 [Trichonephila clavipes]
MMCGFVVQAFHSRSVRTEDVPMSVFLKLYRGLLVTDLVILDHGDEDATPELASPSPNYNTTPTGGRLSSRQILRASRPYTADL